MQAYAKLMFYVIHNYIYTFF